MIDIDRSDEQIMLEETVSRLLQQKFTSEILHEVRSGDNKSVNDLWNDMVAMGLCGLLLSPEYGGAGCGLTDAIILMEQLGQAAAPSPLWGHYLASVAIARAGDSEQKEAWLPRLASGEIKATVAFCHSSKVQSQSEADIVCNWVTFGKSADLCVVIDHSGSWGLLDLSKTDALLEAIPDCIDSSRQVSRLTVSRSVMRPLPVAIADDIKQAGRVLLAAESWGSAQMLLDKTREHVTMRRQFGRLLAEFQAVSQSLADMTVLIDFARPLVWEAAAEYDHGDNNGLESAALCKAHITENALKVARTCIELHGASGFILEGDLHFWFNRIRFGSTLLGTPIQLRREIATRRGWNSAPLKA